MRITWPRREADRYSSGVPTQLPADRLMASVQPLFVVAMILLSTVSVTPLGWSGRGLYGSILLIVNGVLALSRSLPDSMVRPSVRLAIAAVWSIPAGLLFAFSPGRFGMAFAFMLAVHSGIRFERPVAVAVASAASITAMIAMIVDGESYWWIGIFVAVAVAFGMLRRSRNQTLKAAHDLIEQTRKTAESEAKAHTLAERARIAREIHDVLAHSLSGVNMQLSMADALFDADRTDQGREAVRRAQRMVVDGLGEARRAVQALREDAIDLVPAVEAMLTGDHETLEVIGVIGDLPAPHLQTLLRAAQEALTNARRHAAGAPVEVTLQRIGDDVQLAVVNGPGDGSGGHVGSGLGLVGLRERAALAGGTAEAGPVTIGPFAGGWRMAVTVPAGTENS